MAEGQPAGGQKREPGLKRGEHPRGNGSCGAGNSTPRAENSCDQARVVPEGFWPSGGARRKHPVEAGEMVPVKRQARGPSAKQEGPSPRRVEAEEVGPVESGPAGGARTGLPRVSL